MAEAKWVERKALDGASSRAIPVFALGMSLAIFFVFGAIATGLALWLAASGQPDWVIVTALCLALAPGLYILFALKVANEWEKAIVLRAGKFLGLRGPGLFWIVPILDRTPIWIDHRVMVTPFNAEKTLTKDTVPVDVDAVLFWLVYDPEKAALEVQDYPQAVSWAAQTALRDIIGRTSLADLLRGREKIEQELQQLIDARSTPWGVTVQSVEMRDIVIPQQLQEAMSREAQAAREKNARIILGEAEMAIAHSFETASRVYQDNPTALHLRAMNMLYEGLKEKGALMLVPSTAVESMGMGGLLGAAALRQSTLAGGADGK